VPPLRSEGEERGLVAVSSFQAGGRVDRTGIALVHEGEYVVPAPGSEAAITPDVERTGQVVNYYFPVEVEIVGELSESQLRAAADYVYEDLDTALGSYG
jgi:hypothetical protein